MSPSGELIEVACATDEAYCPHAATLMHSAVAACSEPGAVRFHLLHAGLSPSTRAALSAFARRIGFELHLLEVDRGRVGRLRKSRRFPSEIWFRYLVSELLPDTRKLLYLDVDTVVMDSLQPLYHASLGGAHIGAVANVRYDGPGAIEAERVRAYPDGLDIDPGEYFNSGVILADLDLWRRDAIADGLMETALEHPDLDWPDQSVLNIVLGSSWKRLAPRWNATTAMLDFGLGADLFDEAELMLARERPGIRHFEGPGANKPWHYLCRRSFREVYLEHRKATPWPTFTPEGRTPTAVWRRVRGRAKGALRPRRAGDFRP